MSFSCGFVKRIGQSPKNGWKRRFPQSCWIYFVFDKMDLNVSWSLALSNNFIGVEIGLFRSAVPDGKGSVHRIAHSVNDGSLSHV